MSFPPLRRFDDNVLAAEPPRRVRPETKSDFVAVQVEDRDDEARQPEDQVLRQIRHELPSGRRCPIVPRENGRVLHAALLKEFSVSVIERHRCHPLHATDIDSHLSRVGMPARAQARISANR
jgi:hypothetical protein